MFTLLKSLWNFFDAEKQRRESQKKLEEEEVRLEAILRQEYRHDNIFAAMKPFEPPTINSNVNTEKSDCSQQTGRITVLGSDHGMIDSDIFFDMNVALHIFNELEVGCTVEYLSYQKPHSGFIKVVRILNVVDANWNGGTDNEEIQKQISCLKNENPTYFKTLERTIIGFISSRESGSITIDTDYKPVTVKLDEVGIDFVPKAGDHIFAVCNVQSDEHFVDKQGEILQVISISPSRILKREKCIVRKVRPDWGQLNDNAYYTLDVSFIGCRLNVGDMVYADLIECEAVRQIGSDTNYVWRSIRLYVDEDNTLAPAVLSPGIKASGQNINHAATVTDDVHAYFTSRFEKQEVNFTIQNNCERKLIIKTIEIHRRSVAALHLMEPKANLFPFEIQKGESCVLCFEVESRSYGETREGFIIYFEKFRVRRSVHVNVCDGKEAIEAARAETNKENITAETQALSKMCYPVQNSRNYANKVWSKKTDIMPGISLAPSRRFVANRIGNYEVPERMRNTYLCELNFIDVIKQIEDLFCCLREELTMINYCKRFQTLLHLEEIEYFVNFRKYDRERANFTRDGEYLSLTIENLAEQRPSLVIGDVVRATSPWNLNDYGKNITRGFDGIVHKVLFDRILLKFDPGFQSKYNGDDYCLEFFFSRYGLRKQHFAVNRVVKHLGECFLFPSKINLREKKQLEIEMDDDYNLILSNKKCPWYNQSLNIFQKQAICSILRGETENMPYVIFGPPGTGKTMTLVETILQLVKLIPSARLLVGTPSNSSADLITTRIIESGILKAGEFVRLVSQNQVERDLIPPHLMTYCATADVGIDGTCEDSMIITDAGLKLKCQSKYLGRHRVTISTCCTLGTFMQMPFRNGHFTHVLIDESGQCTEPESMTTISQVSQTGGQVILVGDPNQLCPVITNRYAGKRGLLMSFLARVLQRAPYLKDCLRFPVTYGYDPRLLTKLIYNYRALPSILKVYNDLFYDSELLPQVQAHGSHEADLLIKLDALLPQSKIRPKAHGAYFYGVRSENMQEKDSPSWYNPIEAKNIFLMTIQLYRHNIEPGSIGIVTPYTKQVKHIRNLFIVSDIEMPKIGSVEEFQGQERDIILISTVRSAKKYVINDLRHCLGFIQCPKRMNVAISRARSLMFVFGNPHLLALDKCWRTYIKYCIQNHACLGCDIPDDLDRTEDELLQIEALSP